MRNLIRDVSQLDDESWSESERGEVTWKTIFSEDVTGTRGLTSGVATVPAGQQLTPHRHEAVETYYILSGQGDVTLGSERHRVQQGMSMLFPSGVTHGIENTGDTVLEFFYAFAVDSFSEVTYDFTTPGNQPEPDETR